MMEEEDINSIDISEILQPSERGLIKAFCYTPDFCHTQEITCVSISPNGLYVISGSYDMTIRVWDLTTGTLKKRINAHNDWINNVIVSPDGKTIISCSNDKTVKIWDFESGLLLKSFDEFKGDVYSIALSPNGKYLAAGSQENILRIIEVKTGSIIHKIDKLKDTPVEVLITYDGKYVITKGYEAMEVWELKTGKIIKTVLNHNYKVDYLNFFNFFGIDYNLNAFIQEKQIEIRNLDTGAIIKQLKIGNAKKGIINSLLIDLYGNYIFNGINSFFSGENFIRIWDSESGKLLTAFRGVVSPDLTLFVKFRDYMIEVRSFSKLNLINKFKGLTYIFLDFLAVSPRINHISAYIFKQKKRFIHFWSYSNGKHILKLQANTAVNSLVFTPDEKNVIIGDINGDIYIYDFPSGHIVKHYKGHEREIRALAITSDKKFLFSCGEDRSIKIWNYKSGNVEYILEGHNDCINTIIISPDNKFLISGSDDWYIKVWKISDGTLLKTLKGHNGPINSVIISPDSKRIISAGGVEDQTVKIWDFYSGELIHSIEEHSDRVTSVTISPNGKYLASGSTDRYVHIYSSDFKWKFGPFKHVSSIKNLYFTLDSKQLISADISGEILVWDFLKFKSAYIVSPKPEIKKQIFISNYYLCQICHSFEHVWKYFKKQDNKWIECPANEASISMEYCDKCECDQMVHESYFYDEEFEDGKRPYTHLFWKKKISGWIGIEQRECLKIYNEIFGF